MGEIIVRKVKGMNWMAKISLVLIFTMVFSTFMYQGWYSPKNVHAAITYQSAGALAYSAAGGTSVAPAYPASIAAGDLLVLIVGMKPGTANTGAVTTPTGWNAIVSITGAGGYGTTLGADKGNTNLFTYYKVAGGTESGTLDVTINVNGANGVAWAQITRHTKTTGEWSVAGATGSDITGDTTVSIAFGSNPGVTANDHIIGAMCIPTDITTPTQFSVEAFTQTGISAWGTLTEISEPDSANGNDIGGFVINRPVTTGTGTANPTMTATAGGTVTNVRGPGVFIRIREAAGTPPVAGTVTVSPDANGFTSSAPTISTPFTDNESPITSCQYTTNGSTWNAGTLSGTMPNYTCTASPTGLSGALTINMRATSGGGTGTATAINRTVDTTGPTDGTLTAIAGSGQVGLYWTAATDAGIGLATTNTYKVVRATGATPPANCAGAALYQGTALNFADSTVVNDTQYSYRVCAYDVPGNASTGATVTATPSARTGRIASCSQCHAYPPLDGTRSGATGAVVGDHQKHMFVCSTCHVAPATQTSADFAHRNGNINMKVGATAISGGYYDKNNNVAYNAGVDDTFAQVNNPTTASCRNISCHGGNNPTPQWGVGTAGCVNCHSGTAITRTMAPGTLDPVVGEFGLAWGHKKSGRGAVANADCIACHLEGNYSTQAASSYHADGNIDLRDPDGAGETPITNISGGAFTFQKFSMSFAAGSRTSTGHLSNTDIANVITQKFCLRCHDSDGATNTTARSNNGGTGTAAMPFGGINLGANYTVANGAMSLGGLVDVNSQVATTNGSWHPVRGPKNRDFPTAAKLADPYKPTGTRGTSGTLSQGVVMNCFDCHNVVSAPLTARTVAAHGNAVTLRGVATVTGTPSAANSTTLCQVCHTGHYGQGLDNHGTGSAFTGGTDNGMTPYIDYGCNICHGSRYTTAVVRPVRGQDMHGSNVVPTGSITKSGRWAAASKNWPIAFIRNSYAFNDHAPLNITGTAYTPVCMGGQAGQETTACNRGVENYTVGGTY